MVTQIIAELIVARKSGDAGGERMARRILNRIGVSDAEIDMFFPDQKADLIAEAQ